MPAFPAASCRRKKADPIAVLRELNHILGADEVWLSRLMRRPARTAVWPDLTLDEARNLAEAVHAGFEALLRGLKESDLTAGQAFETPIGEILLHVALRAQYHRWKIDQLLRVAGQAPVPADYIAFSRGVPAATTAPKS